MVDNVVPGFMDSCRIIKKENYYKWDIYPWP